MARDAACGGASKARTLKRLDRRTTCGRAGRNDGFTLAVLFSRTGQRDGHAPVVPRRDGPEGRTACGGGLLIAHPHKQANAIRTVLKSEGRLSVVALNGDCRQRLREGFPFAERVQ